MSDCSKSKPAQESEHYSGEPIVTEASFLRRLPMLVSPVERLRYDGIVLAADILSSTYRALRAMTMRAGGDLKQWDSQASALALSCCWTIVDQLFAIRQLVSKSIRDGDEVGPITAAFLQASEPAHRLRNKMDHLAESLGNLAKASGTRSPLYGSLSYFYSGPPPIEGGVIVTIMASRLHGRESMPAVNPAGKLLKPTADLFQLTAFGLTLELAPPLAALRRYIASVEVAGEAQVRDQVRDLAAKHGKTEDELMAHSGGGYAFALAIKFNGSATPAESGGQIVLTPPKAP